MKSIKNISIEYSRVFREKLCWAISEGREAARQVDIYLMGKSDLPTKNASGDLVGL